MGLSGWSSGFSEWLRLDELSLDTSEVDLRGDSSSGYSYDFYRDREDGGADRFEVLMRPDRTAKFGLPEGMSRWWVSFKGPKGFFLTGSSGSGATAVYGRVLSAVKKMMEVEESRGRRVDALHFSSQDQRTSPLYDRFARRFLPGFELYDYQTYVRREALESVLSGMSPSGRESVESGMRDWRGRVDRMLDIVRSGKRGRASSPEGGAR